MKLKIVCLVLVFTFVSPSTSYAKANIYWDTFGSTYQGASFSFETSEVETGGLKLKLNYSTLPLCLSLREINLQETDCIRKLEVTTNGKDWAIGTFDSYVPIREKIKDAGGSFSPEWAHGDIDLMPGASKNNIAGSRSSLWSFPGMNHKNGNQFLVSYRISSPVRNGLVSYKEGFTEIAVQPVVTSSLGTPSSPTENVRLSPTWNAGKQCFVEVKASYCLNFYPFDNTNLKFRLSVVLKTALDTLSSSTWLYAHSSDLYFKQSIIPGDLASREFIFELSPTAVQIPTIILDSESLVNDYVDAILPALPIDGTSEQTRIAYEEYKKETREEYLGNYGVSLNSFQKGSTYLMNKQDKFINPKNTREFIGLRVQTLPLGTSGATGELLKNLRSCPLAFGVGGMMATNATAVETTPPTFDKSSNTLGFRVAAPHLKEDGNLNSGFYKLVLNPQVAKCIWGENLQGAKAEVSMVSDSGEIQLTTSTFLFNSDAAIFEISGFHYSAGTISIKLVLPASDKAAADKAAADKAAADKAVADKAVADKAAADKAAALKKTTITCVKGKVTKKVTAFKPKCPSGYKVKK